MVGAMKTESEQLFEQYLHAAGLSEFAFEKELPGSSRRPDYALTWQGQDLLLWKARRSAEPNPERGHRPGPSEDRRPPVSRVLR